LFIVLNVHCSLFIVSHQQNPNLIIMLGWLVVEPPLWKIWVRQWEGWHPIISHIWNGKIKFMFQTTNQINLEDPKICSIYSDPVGLHQLCLILCSNMGSIYGISMFQFDGISILCSNPITLAQSWHSWSNPIKPEQKYAKIMQKSQWWLVKSPEITISLVKSPWNHKIPMKSPCIPNVSPVKSPYFSRVSPLRPACFAVEMLRPAQHEDQIRFQEHQILALPGAPFGRLAKTMVISPWKPVIP